MIEKAKEPKTLEMRVAELEDKLAKVTLSEEEVASAQKAAMAVPAALPGNCVISQCIQQCIIHQCIQQCIIQQCIIHQCIRQCIRQCFECSCGPCVAGGGTGGAGFSSLGT